MLLKYTMYQNENRFHKDSLSKNNPWSSEVSPEREADAVTGNCKWRDDAEAATVSWASWNPVSAWGLRAGFPEVES